MATLLLIAILVLVVLGFGNNVFWLAAVALLFLYIRYGPWEGSNTPPGGGGGGGGGPSGGLPPTYRAYRERRDREAKWQRRYRRERPFEARRQAREKVRDKALEKHYEDKEGIS
ncbi:hypothetical protein [Streptomyces sp. CRN 30]|uniref:hypothetical protein n=1 Tax=Streptomyces sp. CRN 30 TaxID=3075613 RepID=UPI002A8256AC|nr:hypothetical protein [Streptomyces sp. CRN 30]